MTYLTDLSGRLESFSSNWTLLGIRFTSGDNVSFRRTHGFERLDEPFRIRRGDAEDGSGDVVVPPGEFTSWGWEGSASTTRQRPVAVNAGFAAGGFWTGRGTHLRGGVDVRPRPGVEVGAEYERNDVSLPEGGFATNLGRLSGGFHLSPWMSLTADFQYDDVSRVLGTSARFRWIVRPGSDLYLVYGHSMLEDPTSLDRFRGFRTLDRKLTTKFTYTHRF